MTPRSARAARWGALLGLALILALAGWLRFTGSSWGELQHQHPDENHLSSVADRLRAKVCGDPTREVDTCPPEQRRWIGVRHYFSTPVSTLNPYNRGFSFYVYGNLPLTIVRVVADATGVTDMRQLGRWLSAGADVVAVLCLYVLAAHLYGRRVALLASLFSALAVLQIQQSHFFTVDTFVNVFALPALYFAVRLSGAGKADTSRKGAIKPRDVMLSLAFGIAFGMALASKLIVYPMALVLPAALLARRSGSRENGSPPASWVGLAICVAAGAVATAAAFRVFQPYAFLGWGLNPQWLANLEELQRLASPANDVPWNLQWARRSRWFSFYNLTWWGLGLPIASAAWGGLALMAWRIVRGQRVHALLWAWTLGFFVWQSLQFNPTLRYQLPIYPLLALAAAWFVVEAVRWRRPIGITLGIGVTLPAAIWAFAFQSIYLRDEPRIAASRWIFQHVPGPATLEIAAGDGARYRQPLPLPRDADASDSVTFRFAAARSGELASVLLPHVRTAGSRVEAVLTGPPGPGAAGASADVPPVQDGDPRGPAVRLTFQEPHRLEQGSVYALTVRAAAGPLELAGATIANETDYDYSLPFRIDGYDPFGGIYPGDLNLQVYWDDNEAKRERLVDMLSRADYLFIPTNHQYAQITRLPERYPLTTHYYRELLGCPDGLDTIECYRRANPGVFEGRLGFELAAVFDIPPRLGPLTIDDQAAEEAFTFYDHPTVLIFRKSGDFSADRLRASLNAVDTTRAVRLTPKDFEGFSTLLLPRDDAARHRQGGTWSALFDYDALQNRHPWAGAVIWYAFLTVLGLAVWPWLRLALPSLPDHGYPMARFAGLLIAGYLAWLRASIGGTYSRTSIAVVVGALLGCGAALAWRDRAAIRGEWRERRLDLLTVEALGLALFVAGLLLRVGNPDLWHPARGGERPMDFSYLNAVIRSTTFPPYDPWFAGGYINYYYFGFVLVATPIKLLGIVPSVAYNLALPTLLAMVGLGAFSLGWNLQALDRAGRTACLLGGLATTGFTVLLGNLGTVRLALTKLADGGWAQVAATPPGEWLWRPSRIMPPGPGNEITEFPLFTFIYGDLHAHMMALPLVLAVLTLSLAAVALADRRPRPAALLAFLLFFALVVGALYPTNMADAYTYPAIAAVAVAYAVWRSGPAPVARRAMLAVAASASLVALASILYQPYRDASLQGYSEVTWWTGPRTPLASYLLHWGVFLFLLVGWLAIEARRRLTGVRTTEPRRFVLLMTAVALLVTLMVEFVVVRGDIGRQNTVFKFYLQAWILLAASAAAALVWSVPYVRRWRPSVRMGWTAMVAMLIGGAALFTITATADKVRDRWHPEAPRTLDAMTFMRHAHHEDFDTRMDLAEDYRAIRWLQDNVQGSPVIVEAHCSEYRWCSRMTVYTGLPSVVGWNYHQRQQRARTTTWVTDRVAAIDAFYRTADHEAARRFLDSYDVRYIVVGQLERAQYGPAGVQKFEGWPGGELRAVYRDGATVIYEVLR